MDIATLLGDLRRCHSNFQMDCFITMGNGYTPYGMYMQALRELGTRRDGLEEMYLRREELALDTKEAAQPPGGPPDDQARTAIKLKRLLIEEHRLEESISEAEREFKRFLGQATILKNHLEKDGPLTDERRAELDRDMWSQKLRSMGAVDCLTSGRVQGRTFEFVQQFPIDMRRELVKALQQPNSLVADWQNHNPLDDMDTIPQIKDNIQKMIEG